MRQGWDDYDKAADRGPISLSIKIIVGIAVVVLLGGVMAYALGWLGEAGQVAREETGPRAAVKKYAWFKDAAQQLQAKKANIETAEASLAASKAEWEKIPLTQVPRDVRENQELRRSEILGLKASFNALAADYNAATKKVHWQAFNTEGLPDEFTQYVAQ